MFGKISESIHSIQNVPDWILKEARDYNEERNGNMLVMCHYECDEEESKESGKVDTDNDLVNKFRKLSVERESSWDRKEEFKIGDRSFKEDYHNKAENLFGERMMGNVKFKDKSGYGGRQEIPEEGLCYVENNIQLRYPSLPIPSEYQSTPAHYTASAPAQTSELDSPYTTAKPIMSPNLPLRSPSFALSNSSIKAPLFPISSLTPPSSTAPQSLLTPPSAPFSQKMMNYHNSNTLQELQSKLLTSLNPKPSSSYDPFEGLENVPSASILPPLHTEPPRTVPKKHNPFLHNL